MIPTNLLSSLNQQYNQELVNAATYRSLGWELEALNWAGSSSWMFKAFQEEEEHAKRIAEYIIDQNGVPVLELMNSIQLVASEDLVQYFSKALDLEKINTELLRVLYFEAERAEDAATCIFLQGFITEQVRSERDIVDILTMLERLDNNGRAFYDKEIGTLK